MGRYKIKCAKCGKEITSISTSRFAYDGSDYDTSLGIEEHQEYNAVIIVRLRSYVSDHRWDFCSIAGCEGASNDCWKTCLDSRYNKVRSEAVKEFADKAKEKMRDFAKVDFQGDAYCLISESFFDNLVKEMIGEDNVSAL